MASNEKYQAGESYADTKEPKTIYSLDDPVKIATDVLKELVSVSRQITLSELVDIITSLTQKPLDDKKG